MPFVRLEIVNDEVQREDERGVAEQGTKKEGHASEPSTASPISANRNRQGFRPWAIDGNVVAGTERVLVKNQADQTQNGPYSLTTAGGGVPWVLTRVTDWDQAAEMQTGSWFLVTNGSSNAATSWVMCIS